MRTTPPAIVCALALATCVFAQPPQTVQDEYALYDLLAPDTRTYLDKLFGKK